MEAKLCLLLKKVNHLTELVKEGPICHCRPTYDKALVPWISKTEVMRYLRISKGTYYSWRKKGILKPCSTEGEDRFLIEEINQFILGRGRRQRRRST